jgi:hypothetical protein
MSTHGSLPRDRPAALEPHVCRVCQRPFVVPLSTFPLVSRDGYVVEMECSNCEDSTVALLSEEQMERLDRELDRQTGRLRHALAELRLADELERVDRFAAALHAGHILPEDF